MSANYQQSNVWRKIFILNSSPCATIGDRSGSSPLISYLVRSLFYIAMVGLSVKEHLDLFKKLTQGQPVRPDVHGLKVKRSDCGGGTPQERTTHYVRGRNRRHSLRRQSNPLSFCWAHLFPAVLDSSRRVFCLLWRDSMSRWSLCIVAQSYLCFLD